MAEATDGLAVPEEPPRLLTIRREGAKGDRLLVQRAMVVSFGLSVCVSASLFFFLFLTLSKRDCVVQTSTTANTRKPLCCVANVFLKMHQREQ